MGDDFDDQILPLAAGDQRRFDDDVKLHHTRQSELKAEWTLLKKEDDALLNHVLKTISTTAKDGIETNTQMSAFTALPHTTINRASQYINLAVALYARGNSTTTLAHVNSLLSHRQQPEVTSAALINSHMALWQAAKPLLESPAHPGFMELNTLLSMSLIVALDKSRGSNRTALETHIRNHPGPAALLNPTALIAEVFAAQESDITTLDMVSTQGSAFQASAPPDPTTTVALKRGDAAYGRRDPKRRDHCTNCLKLAGLYFYHKTANCKRKAPPTPALLAAAAPAIAPDAAAQALTANAAVDQALATLLAAGFTFANAPADTQA